MADERSRRRGYDRNASQSNINSNNVSRTSYRSEDSAQSRFPPIGPSPGATSQGSFYGGDSRSRSGFGRGSGGSVHSDGGALTVSAPVSGPRPDRVQRDIEAAAAKARKKREDAAAKKEVCGLILL